ncbi:MAG: DUF1653 domain-containing protein [Leptospira sp.]|nr:DUF1653 domain-containing protein [Leptospira sp.]
MKTYRHKKSGNIYVLIGYAKNCTNENDGQEMIVYQPADSAENRMFVREKNEFLTKFEEC